MEWGTWIIDWACREYPMDSWNIWAKAKGKPWLVEYNDKIFLDEEILQQYEWKYYQEIKEVSNIPLVSFLNDLAVIGYKLHLFCNRPWFTSPNGLYFYELRNLGTCDYINRRSEPRYPKNSDYMRGWFDAKDSQ